MDQTGNGHDDVCRSNQGIIGASCQDAPTRHGWFVLTLLCLMIFSVSITTHAQDAPPSPQGTPVEVRGEDGFRLSGDYYVPFDGDSPAVLLLHQLYTTRRSWHPVIPELLDEGYRVLAVDLRGYGASRGAINWQKAQQDTLAWLDWLADQPGVQRNKLFIIGSSMGANLALNGCAAAVQCAGVVAISPGLNYFGVYTDDAVVSGRQVLIVYADRDRQPAREVPELIALAADSGIQTVSVLSYPGRTHGVDLFKEHDDLMQSVIGWLDER